MKDFNILGVHWKIRLLGKGSSWKTDIEGGLPKNGGLTRKMWVCFLEGVDTPMHTITLF